MSDYKSKYIKYKNKYMKLKGGMEGGPEEVIQQPCPEAAKRNFDELDAELIAELHSHIDDYYSSQDMYINKFIINIIKEEYINLHINNSFSKNRIEAENSNPKKKHHNKIKQAEYRTKLRIQQIIIDEYT